MIAHRLIQPPRGARRGFTLVELLIAVSIMAIMATMVLVAMFGATEAAKRHKTEALIARIDAVIQNKWDSYLTRRVPIDTTGLNAAVAARRRIDVLHDLIRMELPDHWTDVIEGPATPFGVPPAERITRPAASQVYKRRWDAAQIDMPGKPTMAQAEEFQGAECLYLILQATAQEDGDDVSAILKPENVRDLDGDGFPEIVDAWNIPIRFLRWAPGFLSERSTIYTVMRGETPSGTGSDPKRIEFWIEGSVPQSPAGVVGGAIIAARLGANNRIEGWDFDTAAQISAYFYEPDTATSPPTPRGRVVCTSAIGTPGSVTGSLLFIVGPDPFDHQGVYRKDVNSTTVPPAANTGPTFALHPLVYSAGPDKGYGVRGAFNPALNYAANNVNPFYKDAGIAIGFQEQNSDGGWQDNIHNHALGRR